MAIITMTIIKSTIMTEEFILLDVTQRCSCAFVESQVQFRASSPASNQMNINDNTDQALAVAGKRMKDSMRGDSRNREN